MKTELLASVALRAFDNPPGYSRLGYPDPSPLIAAAQSFGNMADQDEMLKRSPDSAAMLDYWDKTDALVDGIKAMRAAGTKFLPKFVDEADDNYQARLNCTKMTNVYRDVVETLASKPFEQEVTLADDAPDAMIKKFIENVDGGGNNITQFASMTMFNGINAALDWIYIDYPKIDEDNPVRTIADLKARGIQPYWSHVLARNVLWPQTAMIDGQETLVYMKILEPGSPDRVRVFTRLPTGAVNWQLFEKTEQVQPDGKTMFKEIDSGNISIGVIPLVPFATGRRDGRTFKYFPAMQDAADLQVELYEQESALKWLKKLGAYSMLSGNGVTPPKNADGTPQKLAVGPAVVLYAPPTGEGRHGDWSFVQPDPAVMKFLADDNNDTINQLRELGRNPLTAQSGNLTVVTAATAAGKARSVVGAWALLLKDALEQAMKITAMWFGMAGVEPTINVYTEFDQFAEGKDIEALNAARYPTNGAPADISRKTYWYELKRRGILSDEFDADEEEKDLLDELPSDGEVTGTLDPAPPIDPKVPPKPVRKPAPAVQQ